MAIIIFIVTTYLNNFYQNRSSIMTNQIGLSNVSEVITQLNRLLSSYQILYSNVRGYHWNVKGEHFFSLHVKFEELYNEIQIQIDEIAERILTLGGTPLHAYSDFTQHTFINEHKNVFAGRDCVEGVVSSLQALIVEQRALAEMAEEAGDQGSRI